MGVMYKTSKPKESQLNTGKQSWQKKAGKVSK